MTLKPVSPLVIPTSSVLPRSGDMGVRDELKGTTWAGEVITEGEKKTAK